MLDTSMVGFYADALSDLEAARIANGNRLSALTRSAEDSDGEIRGYGLTDDHDSVKVMHAVVDSLAVTEAKLTRALEKAMKAHPLGPWMADQHGIGFKQGGRLLASINDPYWNTLYDRPRQVSELWAYCGFHVLDNGTAPKRAKGQKANWSQDARKRCWLIAQSIVKAGGPYRSVYDAAKLKYDGAVHVSACVRCGPSGHPAQPESPLSKAHIHARALRAVSKEVLTQLWIEARRLHGEPA